MKVASSLPLLTIFASAASAFGLNGGVTTSLASQTTRSSSIPKAPPTSMVQPVDIQGNRLSSVVS